MDGANIRDAFSLLSLTGAGVFNLFFSLVFSRIKDLKKLHFNRSAYFNTFGILFSAAAILAVVVFFPANAYVTRLNEFWLISLLGLASIILLFLLSESKLLTKTPRKKFFRLATAMFLYVFFLTTTAALLTILCIKQSGDYLRLRGNLDNQRIRSHDDGYDVVIMRVATKAKDTLDITSVLAKQPADLKKFTYEFYLKKSDVEKSGQLAVGLCAGSSACNNLKQYEGYVFVRSAGGDIFVPSELASRRAVMR